MFKILDEPLPSNGSSSGKPSNTRDHIFDLLNDDNPPVTNNSSNLLEDMLFGSDVPQSTSTNGNSSIPPMTIFNKNGLQIVFNFEKQDKTLLIHLRATNSTSSPINNFVFKAAVPKVEIFVYSSKSFIFRLFFFLLDN